MTPDQYGTAYSGCGLVDRKNTAGCGQDALLFFYTAAGGRNEKAVMAMLDMDTLKESKNQSEDIKKALEDVKKSDGYLFGAKEPINNPVGGTGGEGGADIGGDNLASIRSAMGLPEAK